MIQSRHVWWWICLPTIAFLSLTYLPDGLGGAGSLAMLPKGTLSLALRDVTVIDVTSGERRAWQTVVVVGHRITAVGATSAVRVPADAHIIDARGKYLIPGLWDMHAHHLFGPDLVWNGITGIRDPVDRTTHDSLRHAIHEGQLVGPRGVVGFGWLGGEDDDSAAIVNGVDSAQQLGFYFVKTAGSDKPRFYLLAAEARRVGIRFGGHLEDSVLSVLDVLDSGVTEIDHTRRTSGGLDRLCIRNRNPQYQIATLATCQQVAARMRRNDAWWIPTFADGNTGVRGHRAYPDLAPSALLATERSRRIADAGEARGALFAEVRGEAMMASNDVERDANGTEHKRYQCPSRIFTRENWLRDSARFTPARDPHVPLESNGMLTLPFQAGMPLLAGADAAVFAVHVELALMVSEGLSPLAALQAATLNPAKYLHATDSLGTVAAGKLADLVLLDADPLVDITNTTAIWAVVADGHYYDRAALDTANSEC